MKKTMILFASAIAALASFAEIQIINGVKYECTPDGLCRMIVDDENPSVETPSLETPPAAAEAEKRPSRIAQGFMVADEFLAFLRGEETAREVAQGLSLWVFVLAVLAGLAMNLSPCVLPMVPVNIAIIGKSMHRGLAYGAGIAAAYGTMGLLAALGSLVFGELQSNPWFNLAIAAVFLLLALSMMGVFFIDFSRFRGSFADKKGGRLPMLFAFAMGVVSAVLAGACVAPVLIAVLLLTANLVASGIKIAVVLPFAVGVGMALPWPFVAAGLKLLPKPGAWMGKVEKAFGVFVLALAAYYGFLAYRGFAPVVSAESITPAQLMEALESSNRPVLVDCWASWCKNCTAMEKTTLKDSRVAEQLKNFTVIRVQAEDIRELTALPGLGEIRGLPAFIIYE